MSMAEMIMARVSLIHTNATTPNATTTVMRVATEIGPLSRLL